MSQHIYNTTRKGSKVQVLMGWDRPLGGFFLVVEDLQTDDDCYLYSNLEDPTLVYCNGLPRNIAYFQVKLVELGLHVPDQMIQEIINDQKNNVGNRVVHYDEAGRIDREIS